MQRKRFAFAFLTCLGFAIPAIAQPPKSGPDPAEWKKSVDKAYGYLKGRQGDTRSHHVRTEGMSKSVRIGGRNGAAQSMMTE